MTLFLHYPPQLALGDLAARGADAEAVVDIDEAQVGERDLPPV
jgi:hypothetical protein